MKVKCRFLKQKDGFALRPQCCFTADQKSPRKYQGVATVTQDFAKQCLERFGVKMSQKAEIKEEKSPFTSDIVSK